MYLYELTKHPRIWAASGAGARYLHVKAIVG